MTQINGNSQSYIDLKNSFLYVKLKVYKDGKKILDKNEDVSTTNLFLHSLFDTVEVSLNDKVISSKTSYSYLAYILNQLSCTGEEKVTFNTMQGYKDENPSDKLDANNPGYVYRKKLINESKACELVGNFLSDIFLQDRFILPNVDIKIVLRRAPVTFSLLSPVANANYQIEFENLAYYVRRYTLTPNLRSYHINMLNRNNAAVYPFVRNEIKTFSVSTGMTNIVKENLFSSSKLPERIVIGIVSTSGYNGAYGKNAYAFNPFALGQIKVSVDDDPSHYSLLNLDFDGNGILACKNLFEGLEITKAIGINVENYKNGNTLYSFKLAPSRAITEGSVKIELIFSTPTTESLTVLLLSHHSAIMCIDRFNQVNIVGEGIFS